MDTINELLTRRVENIIPAAGALETLLRSGKKLNVYIGIDPTAVNIHLGNAVQLRNLRTLNQMGHHVTFLIGDFTALIGDTSDKDKERPSLSYKTISENFKNYQKQAEKFLDFSAVDIRYNSEWLGKLNFSDIIQLCQHFSVGDFVSRELIRKRMDSGTRVGLHEMLYPVMQGYDSYFLDTDIQLGGTDQTFNMQAGRTLQKSLRNKDSFVIAGKFLMGTDGRKMSKSWGNAIWLNDLPDDIYGKVMSLKDELIVDYFNLATDVSLEVVSDVKQRLANGENPILTKKELAKTIVTELYSSDEAAKAEQKFESTFSQKALPTELETIYLPVGGNSLPTLTLLTQTGLVKSNAEAKRLIKGNAVEIGGVVVNDPNSDVSLENEITLRIGKKRFVKVAKNE